ncbi:MAG TPA: glycosyltransferase [Streptosporangiaceae bacterium]|nr:glycosyltransferase [Streptosporangiaceae bacterium]
MTAQSAAAQGEAAPAAAAQAGATRQVRVLQRVVFPGDDLDVLPLYVETNMERGAAELASELLTQSLTKSPSVPATPSIANAVAGEAQTSIRFGSALHAGEFHEATRRRSAVISAGRRVSFGTYFNAFPASYWRRWTTVDTVTLRIRLAGEATIFVYRSTAKGYSHRVQEIDVRNDEPQTIEISLPLTPFIDGGWYWFDVVAGARDTALIEAEWAALTEPIATGRISIGITTFNRPEFMVEQLRTLGEATEVLDLVDAIYVVDQGTNRVSDYPDFADASKAVGDKLRIITQGNIGGSGGFARAMDETQRAGQSRYVLLLDDDISLDPEGILRAVAFGDLARRPTIVGGHMFSLYDRSVLHAFAEIIAPYRFWWTNAPQSKSRHDFGRRNLRNTPWLHRRFDSDYNGWWMCLIPTRIISEIGLALPVFIKWDDAEYGLRARKAGYPTVSMPGVAAWHVPWQDKNDALDWQAYYHLRNRLIAALLHSGFDHGGTVLHESEERQLQALLSMQYSTAELRLLAIEDVLAGPAHLHRDLGSKMARLRELRQKFSDAQARPELESFPPTRGKGPATDTELAPPANKIDLLRKVAAGALHQLRPPKKGASKRPQAAVPYQDANWWVLVKMDSVLVSSADGTSTSWYKRDPKMFRSLSLRSVVAHRRLRRRWARLAAEYRAAATEFTSPAKWRETFAASVGDPPDRP